MPFVQSFRVGWIDTDASGRIHYTAVFRWVETTEMALLRSRELLGPDTADYPRKHVEAEYLTPLGFDDQIDVALAPTRIGGTSVTFAWSILRDGALAVRGRHTLVHVGPDGRPAPLGDELRAELRALVEDV
jgi:acyl-CoA thioesterase FadM